MSYLKLSNMKEILMRCLMIVGMLFVTNFVVAQEVITHTVERGETLESIAQKYHVTKSDIKKNNPYVEDAFYVGLKLYIPNVETQTKSEDVVTQKEVYSNPVSMETPIQESNNSSYSVNNVANKPKLERISYFGLGFYSYDGFENYSLSFGNYGINNLGVGANLRSNFKFKDNANTYNGDVLLNFSVCLLNNDDVTVLIIPEVGPSFASRYVYDDGKMKDKFFIDGFLGIKAAFRYKFVMISAGYHLWAPKWKFGKDEKKEGFYAQLGLDI
jgi:hypothetical protein